MPNIAEPSFDDRLSLLLEREKTERQQRRYVRLEGLAKLHFDATIEVPQLLEGSPRPRPILHPAPRLRALDPGRPDRARRRGEGSYPSSSSGSPGLGSSSSTTGALALTQARDTTTLLKVLTTATSAVADCAPARGSPSCYDIVGDPTFGATPSSTGSSTTRTASPSRALR